MTKNKWMNEWINKIFNGSVAFVEMYLPRVTRHLVRSKITMPFRSCSLV